MGVLAAVFTDAVHVAFDVAWVIRGAVKGRGEQKNQSLGATHLLPVDCVHGARRTARFSSPAYDSPGLRDRVDPAFRIFHRAKRRSIIIIGAAIPFAIPSIPFERRLQGAHVEAPSLGTFVFTARIRNFVRRTTRLATSISECFEARARFSIAWR